MNSPFLPFFLVAPGLLYFQALPFLPALPLGLLYLGLLLGPLLLFCLFCLYVLYPLVILALLLSLVYLLVLEHQHLQQDPSLLANPAFLVGRVHPEVLEDQLIQEDQLVLDSLLAPEALELLFVLDHPVFLVDHYSPWLQVLPYPQEDQEAHPFPLPHPPQLVLAPPLFPLDPDLQDGLEHLLVLSIP